MTFTVEALPFLFGEKRGYDLIVTDSGASVQHYLDVPNQAIGKLSLSCHRKNATACAGCGICCGDTVPLTRIDILNLQKHLGADNEYFQQLLTRGGYSNPGWQWVEYTLPKGQDGLCIFLDRESRLCSIHQARPLACRVYFGCRTSPRAGKVRDYVFRMAKNDTLSQWLIQNGVREGISSLNEGRRPRPKPNAFSGKNDYSQILLKDLLPPELWRQVYVQY